ncbi:hypothetical protein GGX14DRAFT_390989 [Mycena pura]|uniref:Uncharacterized protein n=1 Tax=Mycena pura TaxID=153505 RepID=A0AAD6YFK3_9AGAR|nr:hypothetical protein GGX14DRAFT_390989 [Mycena pura]
MRAGSMFQPVRAGSKESRERFCSRTLYGVRTGYRTRTQGRSIPRVRVRAVLIATVRGDRNASLDEKRVGSDKTAETMQPEERFAVAGARAHAGLHGPVLRQSQRKDGSPTEGALVLPFGLRLLEKLPNFSSAGAHVASASDVGELQPGASLRPEVDCSRLPLKALRLSVKAESGSVTWGRSPPLSPARRTDWCSCGQEREQLRACSGEAGVALLTFFNGTCTVGVNTASYE